MQCATVAEQLLARDEDPRLAGQVEQHLEACPRCTTLARRLGRLDGLLQSALVVEPPADLQLQLVHLARAAAHPPEQTQRAWWERLWAWFSPSDGLLLTRPNVAIAQSLAALMLVLSGWQVLGWLNTFTPVVGDVPYAMQLVASSPAAGYLGAIQSFDFQNLLIWSGVGFVGWLVSESGPIGRSRVVG